MFKFYLLTISRRKVRIFSEIIQIAFGMKRAMP